MISEKIAKALWDIQSSLRGMLDIRNHLIAYGCSLVMSVEQVIDMHQCDGQHACRVQIKLTLLHSSGEELSIVAWGEGQDHGDKAIYKAITGARKYGLACLFNLATSDDPERDARTDEPPVAAAPAPKEEPKYERKPTKSKAKQQVPAQEAEPNEIPMGTKIKACLEHFRFESISQADLELWAGRHALIWDRDIMLRLEEFKEDPDELRKQIRQLKKEQ